MVAMLLYAYYNTAILMNQNGGKCEWPQRGNDFWLTHITPERTGLLEFRIKAWVSEIESWLTAFQKKHDAGVETGVEEQSGRAILRSLSKLAGKEDREAIKNLDAYYNDKRLEPGFIEPELLKRLSQLSPTGRVSSSEIFLINVERKKAQFSTWYELFPRSCATEPGIHGNFRDVAALLPRIARAGFDVLYLPPVHPIGKLKRKGKNNSLVADQDDPGSPWAIGNHLGGHKSLHPELGDMDDFRYLIAQANAHHIELAMDIALQCALITLMSKNIRSGFAGGQMALFNMLRILPKNTKTSCLLILNPRHGKHFGQRYSAFLHSGPNWASGYSAWIIRIQNQCRCGNGLV